MGLFVFIRCWAAIKRLLIITGVKKICLIEKKNVFLQVENEKQYSNVEYWTSAAEKLRQIKKED